jgi:5'-nucleotidase
MARSSIRERFVLVGLAAAILAAAAVARQSRAQGPVSVQLIAINDFHGNLEPPTGSNGLIGRTPAGGAEYLATHLKNAIARNPNSVIVAAGDLIGASPLVSALFHDEPTIEAMNAMNVAVTSVGNHEFDRGPDELRRMQKGGCHPSDGCQDGDGFAGATFQYLSANVIDQAGQKGSPLFPPTAVRTIGGVKIGFIGETLKNTPRIVTPAGVRGLTFLDEATTANTYAAELKQQGVRAIVLLIHEGGEQSAGAAGADPNGCRGFSGDIARIAEKLTPDIKVVISGHTHQFYNCTIAGHSVTSASSFGRMITRVDLKIDPTDDTITSVLATNEIVGRNVAKDPSQAKLIARYAAISAPIANRIVGSVTGDIKRAANRAGESALGDAIADAQLASTSPADKGGAVVAFTNPGGIRADVIANNQVGNEQPGQITYSELFAVQPFSNPMMVATLTGDMIKRLLEQQFGGLAAGTTRILQVSSGFTYNYRLNAPPGQHVAAASIKIKGLVVAPNDRVRVATNSFLASGGDGFSVFGQGGDQLGGDIDVDALVAYFRTYSPLGPGPLNRIVRLD